MRVAINLLGLPSLRVGGSGFYVETLLSGLANCEGVELRVLSGEGVASELERFGDAFEVVSVARGPTGLATKVAGLARSRLRDPRRHRDGYRVAGNALAGIDVVHYPISAMPPPMHDLPCVVTVLDVQHLAAPGNFSRSDRLLRAARWHPAFRAADRLIAYSDFIRGELDMRLGIDPHSVDVVPIACHERFLSPPPSAHVPLDPFVFYPATPLPAKNHARLLRAWRRVAQQRPGASLVLSGPEQHDWGAVASAIRELGLDECVQLEGFLSLSDLHAHYARARGLIFPSLYEGFGIPLIEAMASGCPIAASGVASIPEVVGDAAHLFDPRDEDAVVDALLYLLDLREDARLRVVARGHERSRHFTREAMVSGTLASYDATVRLRGRSAVNARIAPGSGNTAERAR